MTPTVEDSDVASDVDHLPAAGGSRSWRGIAINALRIVFTAAVMAGVTFTVANQWPQVKGYLTELTWHAIVLSLAMVLLSLMAGTMAWRAACEAVGHKVKVRDASQIYVIGLLAKYLPGSVWAFVLQMELGKRANLPRSRSFVASIVTVGIGVTVSLMLGLVGLPALDDVGRGVAITLIALIPLSLICAHPKVLTRLVAIMLRLLRRPQLEQPFTWNAVGKIAFWSLACFTASGAHLWLLVGSTSATGLIGLLRCIGAIGLALTVGLFVFLVPSGIGVREVIIVATLLPYVPNQGAAIAIAGASRLIFVIGDLVAAGCAALLGIGDLRKKVRARARRTVAAVRSMV